MVQSGSEIWVGITAIIKIGWIIGCVIILNSFVVFALVFFLSKILGISNNNHVFNTVIHGQLQKHIDIDSQNLFERIIAVDNKKKWRK